MKIHKKTVISGIILIIIIILLIIIYILKQSSETRETKLIFLSEEYKNQISSVWGYYAGRKEFEIEADYYDELFDLLHIVPVKNYSNKTKKERSQISFDMFEAYGITINFYNGEKINIEQDQNMLCLHIVQKGENKDYAWNDSWIQKYRIFWNDRKEEYRKKKD